MKITTAVRALIVLAVAVTLAAPVLGGQRTLDRMGELGGLPDLQAMVKEALSGRVPPGVTVEKLDSGLTKVAIPLRPDSPVLRQTKAKDLINCAITVEISRPTFAAQLLTFDAAPLLQFDYWAGWLTINTSASDIVASSSIKSKGPGPDLNTGNQNLTYTGSSFNLFFVQHAWDGGLHSVDAKVKGAKPGKLKTNICVDCA